MTSGGWEYGQRPLYRVLDCSESIAGQFAATMLAGFGADVVRPVATVGEEGSGTARLLDRGVTGVRPGSVQDWEALVGGGDCLLVSAPEGPWGRIEEIRERWPAIVIVAATPRGLANLDPTPSTALTIAAESGFLSITGEPDSPPEAIRGHVTDFACGWAIATAATAALRERDITGGGQLVDLSLLEVFVFLQWNATQRAAFENVVMKRQGARGLGHPWGVYPCKDGHVVLIVGAGGRNWAKFAELMNIPELADEKFQSPAGRAEHADQIDALMLPWLLEHTAEEIFTLAQEAGLPFGMIRRPAELLTDEQLLARNFFVPASDGLLWPQLPFRVNGRRPQWGAAASIEEERV